MADVSKVLELDRKTQSRFLKKGAKSPNAGTLVRPKPVPVPEPKRPSANGSDGGEKE